MNIVTNGIVPESAVRILGDDEALVYLSFVNISDLQARNVIQQEQSENRDSLLETILNTTQTPIFWKDENRRFVGANRAFLDYYGFLSQDSIVGKTDEDMDGTRIRCSSRMMKKMFCRVLLPIWYTVNAEDVVRSGRFWQVKARSIATAGLRD